MARVQTALGIVKDKSPKIILRCAYINTVWYVSIVSACGMLTKSKRASIQANDLASCCQGKRSSNISNLSIKTHEICLCQVTQIHETVEPPLTNISIQQTLAKNGQICIFVAKLSMKKLKPSYNEHSSTTDNNIGPQVSFMWRFRRRLIILVPFIPLVSLS